MSDDELAARISEISPLERDDAREALRAGGRARELALSLLKAESQFSEDRQKLAAAKQKLRELTPA